MSKLLTFTFIFISATVYSQNEYGLEYQHGFGRSYNSNSIGAFYEKFNTSNGSWQILMHYTWDVFYSKKKTQGVGDFGLSFGYRYSFAYGDSGNLLGGIRATFSHLFETDHTKFTPSVEFGYHFLFNNFSEGAFVAPSLAFGYDIPVGKEKAEDFAGALFIPRIGAGYRY
jgi:hypothetical protein